MVVDNMGQENQFIYYAYSLLLGSLKFFILIGQSHIEMSNIFIFLNDR